MAKSGPSLVISEESGVVSAATMSYICSMSEINILHMLYKSMNVKQITDLTALISGGAKIKTINIKLTEPSGEQGFALATHQLVHAILASQAVSQCNIQIDALAFELNCRDKKTLSRAVKELPNETVLREFSKNEGRAPVEQVIVDDLLTNQNSEILSEDAAIFDALGELSTTVAALPGQAIGGLFNLYQQMGRLQIGSLPFSSCMAVPSSCATGGEPEEEIQQRRDKKLN